MTSPLEILLLSQQSVLQRPPLASGEQTAGTVVPTGSWTHIAAPTVSAYGSGLSITANGIPVVTAGLYLVSATATFPAPPAACVVKVSAGFYTVNPSTVVSSAYAPTTTGLSLTACGVVSANAGTSITALLWQNSGSSMTITEASITAMWLRGL